MTDTDKQPSALPGDLETSDEIRAVIDRGSHLADRLLSALDGPKYARAALACSLLWEYLVRLDWRYHDLERAGAALSSAARDDEKQVRTRQLQLVDRTESFHRQAYGTLSALLLLLSHAAPRRVTNHLPISSVQAFLSYLREQPSLAGSATDLDELSASVRFRSLFLDHPQQSKLHHWMTMATPSETLIIYYVPSYVVPVDQSAAMGSTGSYQYVNPRAPGFWPAIVCSSFQVSPLPQVVQRAMCAVIHAVIGWCSESDDAT